MEKETERTIRLERIDLSHNLQLHLLSFDKQLIAFTDKHVSVIERFQLGGVGKGLPKENRYISDFEVVMVFENGKWKIKELVEQERKAYTTTFNKNDNIHPVQSAKGINYYPKEYPWNAFWKNYNPVLIEKDFKKISSSGYNSIRIFIQYGIFGEGNVNRTHLAQLMDLLDLADKYNLKVMPCLFDFPHGFELQSYSAYENQMAEIMHSCADHPAIYAWDIKNEADLDYKYYGKEKVDQWISYMISKAKEYSKGKPITIGWSNIESAKNFSNELEFVSFHYYADIDKLARKIQELKKDIPNRILCISEFGISSKSLDKKLNYVNAFEKIMISNDVNSSFAWCYSNFDEAPSEVFGWKPWIKAKQKSFGLLQE